MSELDEAMLRRIRQITCKEDRPFTFKDLLRFKVDEIEYKMTHETFRNKISKLKSSGIVELYCNSGIGFYTLKGHKFSKDASRGGTGGLLSSNSRSNNPIEHSYAKRSLSQMLQSVPLDKRCIHNIRLKFKVHNIWNTLNLYLKDNKDNNNNSLRMNSHSKDIYIPKYTRDNVSIHITIHCTDTVEVILGCSLAPIELDDEGLIRFSTALARIEEYLTSLLESSFPLIAPNSETYIPSIPSYKHWIITMWHLGRDSLTRYSGQKFDIEFQSAHGVIIRAYSKQWKNKNKIRMEVQEYPNKPIEQLIQERIYAYE